MRNIGMEAGQGWALKGQEESSGGIRKVLPLDCGGGFRGVYNC